MFGRISITLVGIGLSASTVLAQTEPSVIREITAPGPEANAQAGIQAEVDAFIADLGQPNNGNAVGTQAGGHRRITWDGADDDAAPARLPANFFNAIAPRGAIFDTDPRIQFQISADAVNATNTLPEFGNVNANYPIAFSTFSTPRLFASLTSNIIDVQFFVPGSLTPATVTGFGAVFTDVDISDTSKLEFYDIHGNLIYSRTVLATAGDESLSFLGVKFDTPIVHRVRITCGTGPLGPDDVTQGGTTDVVVLDDFIYGEPVAVPDTDGDGVLDHEDECPDDPDKTHPGACGCGVSDNDADNDGVPDCFDLCAGEDDTVDADGDTVPDCFDVCAGEDDRIDSDNDGVPDCLEQDGGAGGGGGGAAGCAPGIPPMMAMMLPAWLLVRTSRRYRIAGR